MGWTFIACGLIVTVRRRQSWSGGLLAATGFAWFIPNFAGVGPSILSQGAAYALFLHRGPLFHLLLTYPTGRTSSHLTRWAVVVGYGAAVIYPVWNNDWAAIALSVLLVAVSVHQYVHSVGPNRRGRRVALSAAIALGFLLAGEAIVRLASSTGSATDVLLDAYEVMLGAIAVGLTAELVSAWWERAAVTDLVVELGEVRSRHPARPAHACPRRSRPTSRVLAPRDCWVRRRRRATDPAARSRFRPLHHHDRTRRAADGGTRPRPRRPRRSWADRCRGIGGEAGGRERAPAGRSASSAGRDQGIASTHPRGR